MKLSILLAVAALFATTLSADAERLQCECTEIAGFSSAQSGECKVHDTRKPSCHLDWYDLENVSETVINAYEHRRAAIETMHLPRLQSHILDGLDAPQKYAPEALWGKLNELSIEPRSFHFALGYIALTDPERYEAAPLAQSLLLLLSVSVYRDAKEEGVWRLTQLIAEHAETLRNRMAGGEGSGEPIELEAPSGGTVLDVSARGCADLRFNNAVGFGELSALLLKVRVSGSRDGRC